jgi:hypothetical protein
VGLIAREIEAQGIPTLCLTSALSITRSVNPPRAAFLDFPLGHTAGKPGQPELQDAILEAALGAFEALDAPGEVLSLPFHWSDDDAWKDSVMRPRGGGAKAGEGGEVRDERSERSPEPQYQTEADRVAAEGRSAESGSGG